MSKPTTKDRIRISDHVSTQASRSRQHLRQDSDATFMRMLCVSFLHRRAHSHATTTAHADTLEHVAVKRTAECRWAGRQVSQWNVLEETQTLVFTGGQRCSPKQRAASRSVPSLRSNAFRQAHGPRSKAQATIFSGQIPDVTFAPGAFASVDCVLTKAHQNNLGHEGAGSPGREFNEEDELFDKFQNTC